MGIGKIILTIMYLAISLALILTLTLAPGRWGWGELQAEEEAPSPVSVGGQVITPQQAQTTPPATATPKTTPSKSSSKTRSSGSSSRSGSGSGAASTDTSETPIEVKTSSQELTLRQGDSYNLVFEYDPEDSFRWYFDALPGDGVIGSCAELFYPDPMKEGAYKLLFKFTAAEAGETEFELVYRNHYYLLPVVLKKHTVKVTVVEAEEDDPYPSPQKELALRYGETWRVAMDLPPLVEGEPEQDLRLADGWDQRVLQLKSLEHIVPPGDEDGRGFYLWTFRAIGPGQAKLKIEQFVKGKEDAATPVYEGTATVYCPTPRTREIDVEASGEFTLKFDADAGAGYHWDLKAPWTRPGSSSWARRSRRSRGPPWAGWKSGASRR